MGRSMFLCILQCLVLVLSKIFFSLHCFDFIDWQLMFNIFKGSDFALALVLLFLIGVEA
jgi:hypothetical protein